MMNYWIYEFPLAGRYGIAEENDSLCRVFPVKDTPAEGCAEETPLLKEAARQLREYFAGERRSFALPLSPEGTPFRRRVWERLLEIPYGETTTYGEIAAALGKPKGAQAVGQAVGANPLPFLIPCHRVVGKNGALTGFALGIELKGVLLEHERVQKEVSS